MTRSCRRWFWVLGAVLAATLAVAIVIIARLRDPEPSLIQADAISGMTLAYQDEENAIPPGATWCPDLGGGRYVRRSPVKGSVFHGDGEWAGAMIVNPSVNGRDAAAIIAAMESAAAWCSEHRDPSLPGNEIEPWAGLPEGAVGWHLTRRRGGWGEIAAIPLDADRVVLVGIDSLDGDVPIDIRDLLALALEGAEQFPADAG
jgi:hypothetical protein